MEMDDIKIKFKDETLELEIEKYEDEIMKIRVYNIPHTIF